MFPNVRLMAASTLASVMALFFAFGVYASLRVSHAPLARSSRAAPLQLVGFNVAMLPVTVLEPFADPHPAPAAADNNAVLAYSAPQAAPPQAAPPVVTPDAHAENAAADEPVENSDVTQTQITGALETAREPKAPDASSRASVEPAESMEQSTADAAPPPASAAVVPPTAPDPPRISPAERTAAIETIPAAVREPAALTDDMAVDTDIAPRKKKKRKHIVWRHFYRMPLRAVAQSSAPPQPSSIWPAGIGGPLVAAPKR
jgi:hypothetical protein